MEPSSFRCGPGELAGLAEHEAFYIDFTALLRRKSRQLMELCSSPEGARSPQWYVPAGFDRAIDLLLSDRGMDFCTEPMLDALQDAWEPYRALGIGLCPQTDAWTGWRTAILSGRPACLVTGDEAAALAGAYLRGGDVLLVTDEDCCLFREGAADWRRELALPRASLRTVPELEGNCCEVGESGFWSRHRRVRLPLEELISADGAEGVIWSAAQGRCAVKIFDTEVADQKLKKLKLLCALPAPGPNFAWPQELVYSPDRSVREPVGFVMPRFADCRGLEELFYLNVSPHVRWKAAVSFLAQVLRLHLLGVLVGDFNLNNFAITDDCDVLFMDVDSYVYRGCGTQVRGQQPLPVKIDYSRYFDVFYADSLLTCSMVFSILTGGLWPYYYNEDTGKVESRLEDPDRAGLEALPPALRETFCTCLTAGSLHLPETLYLELLEEEPLFR